jgi:hypothetical protein
MTETAEKLKLELSHLSIQKCAEVASFLIHSLDKMRVTMSMMAKDWCQ